MTNLCASNIKWKTMVLVMYFNGFLLSPSVTMCCKCDTQFMQASFTLVPPVSSTIHRDFTARKPDRAGPTKHNKNMNAEESNGPSFQNAPYVVLKQKLIAGDR
jgi:hypothetical protein